jgi:release factor glutamine methyltransferase
VQLRATLTSAIERLTAEHVPSPRLNSELLLMFTLSCDRAYLYAHSERELTAEEAARYEEALSHRIRGVPAQYITGHQEFWGLDLIVGPTVLIPRPETEHVIETVLRLAKEKPLSSSLPNLKIVDVGTGSGAIALALAKELPSAEIHATDISPAALEIAEANAARLQMESRIKFHDGDLLAALPNGEFDFVVSNPPYVGKLEEDQVQLDVHKFEPRDAVFAGETGLEIIERLVPAAEKTLKAGGWLVMEISGTIAARVRDQLVGWTEVEIIRDLQGIERVVQARKPEGNHPKMRSATRKQCSNPLSLAGFRGVCGTMLCFLSPYPTLSSAGGFTHV